MTSTLGLSNVAPEAGFQPPCSRKPLPEVKGGGGLGLGLGLGLGFGFGLGLRKR